MNVDLKMTRSEEQDRQQVCIGPSHIGSVLRAAHFLVRVEL